MVYLAILEDILIRYSGGDMKVSEKCCKLFWDYMDKKITKEEFNRELQKMQSGQLELNFSKT